MWRFCPVPHSPVGGGMFNWSSMFTWALILAGAAVVLALAMHFLVPAKGIKIPAVVIGTLGGLVLGVCIGMTAAVYYGDEMQKQVYSNEYRPEPMPSAGIPKGQNTGGGDAAPPPEKKKAGGASGKRKGGPASGSMPSDYPGQDDAKSKTKSEDAPDKGGEAKKSDAP